MTCVQKRSCMISCKLNNLHHNLKVSLLWLFMNSYEYKDNACFSLVIFTVDVFLAKCLIIRVPEIPRSENPQRPLEFIVIFSCSIHITKIEQRIAIKNSLIFTYRVSLSFKELPAWRFIRFLLNMSPVS